MMLEIKQLPQVEGITTWQGRGGDEGEREETYFHPIPELETHLSPPHTCAHLKF